jgi:rubrerythrin
MSKIQTNGIAEYLNCQSILESQTSLLYHALSEKVELPLIKTLLKEIELDSQKHSILLKGVSQSFKTSRGTLKDCSKTNQTLQTIALLLKEVDKMATVSSEDLKKLNAIFITLESQMGEEYFMLVQMKTLERMSKIINEEYSIDLTKVKSIFLKIIQDEERHIEVLETIKQMTADKELSDNSPFVRFQNPDSWFKPKLSSVYEE